MDLTCVGIDRDGVSVRGICEFGQMERKQLVMFVLITGHWLDDVSRALTAGQNTKAVIRWPFRAESSRTLIL